MKKVEVDLAQLGNKMRKTTRSYVKRLVVVDVEADGKLLGTNSMVCFGAVLLADPSVSFYGKTKPLSNNYDPEALAVSGFSREEHETFDDPEVVMNKFDRWLNENVAESPILVSDNNQFDGSWINWYFLSYLGKNPFGHSSRRIGDYWSGVMENLRAPWKHMRITPHTHNPVDDARGNAEAYLRMLISSNTLKVVEGDIVKVKGEWYQVDMVNYGFENDGHVYGTRIGEEPGSWAETFYLTDIEEIRL